MPGQLKAIATIDFGAGDLPAGATVDWEPAEDGRRWARGRTSTLSLVPPSVNGDLVLMFTVDPFVCAALPKQTLRILVNGATARLARFGRRAVIACRVGRDVVASAARLDLTFEHPDIVKPNMVSNSSDSRGLSIGFISLSLASWHEKAERISAAIGIAPVQPVALPGEATLSDAELMPFFASLGDNCEFGMAQRMAGAEPMDLLRFAGLSNADLLWGIKDGFKNIETLDDLQFEVRPAGGRREYILSQRRYQLDSHTTVFEGEMDAPRLFRREMNKLAMFSRLFRTDLRDARRIFVYKRNDVTSSEFVRPILEAIRQWGPNTLLHVVQAVGTHRPGTVERIGEGLLRGYIDRFSSYDNAAAPPSQEWLALCRNSYRLWQQEQVEHMHDTVLHE
jgi:hypothetical protein